MKTTDTFVIHFGGQDYNVGPLPLGRLAVVVPATMDAMDKLRNKDFGAVMLESAVTAVTETLAAFTGQTVAELRNIKTDLPELMTALSVVAEVTGILKKRGEEPGEVLAQTAAK